MTEEQWKSVAMQIVVDGRLIAPESVITALYPLVQQAIAAERGEPVAEKALRVADELFTAALKLPADEQHLWLFSEEGMDAWQTIRGAIHGFDHECLSAPPTEAQIRADEQERCAKVAERYVGSDPPRYESGIERRATTSQQADNCINAMKVRAAEIAAAIRSLKEPDRS